MTLALDHMSIGVQREPIKSFAGSASAVMVSSYLKRRFVMTINPWSILEFALWMITLVLVDGYLQYKWESRK